MNNFKKWRIVKANKKSCYRSENLLRHEHYNSGEDCVKVDEFWVCSWCYTPAPKGIAYVADLCKCHQFKDWRYYGRFKQDFYAKVREAKNL